MKKHLFVTLTIASALLLSACGSGVSQAEHEELTQNYSVLQEKNDQLQSVLDETKAALATVKSDYTALKSEYDSYKEKMEPYESLDAAEAEAREIKAQKTIAKQKAAEEAAAAKEAAERAEEEAKGYETGITYDNIARNPDDYKGKKVKFTGKVIQVIEGDVTIQIRLAVNEDYDQVVFCEYESSIVSSRVLEDDVITIYGLSAGTVSYQSTLGGQITIPSILVERIDQ